MSIPPLDQHASIPQTAHTHAGSVLSQDLSHLITQHASQTEPASTPSYTTGLEPLVSAMAEDASSNTNDALDSLVKTTAEISSEIISSPARPLKSALKQPGAQRNDGARINFNEVTNIHEFDTTDAPIDIPRAQSDINAGVTTGKSEPIEVTIINARKESQTSIDKLKEAIKKFLSSLIRAFSEKLKSGSMHGMNVADMSVEDIEAELARIIAFDGDKFMKMTTDKLLALEELFSDMYLEIEARYDGLNEVDPTLAPKLAKLLHHLQSVAEEISNISAEKANAVAAHFSRVSDAAKGVL